MVLPKLLKTKITRENFVLVGVLIILFTLPLTVILLGIRQELRKRAEGVNGAIEIVDPDDDGITTSRTVTLTLTAPIAQQSFLKVPQVHASGLPDLTCYNIQLDPTNPTAGQEVKFKFTYKNVGDAPSESWSKGQVFIDDQPIYETNLAPQPSGVGNTKDWFPPDGWTATAGSHTVRVKLDTQNAVEESDEYNNECSKTFTVCCYGEGTRGNCPGTPFAVCENGVDYFCCKFTPGGWAWHKRIDHPCGTLGPCLSFGACILYEYLPPGWEGQTWGCCDPETDQWLPESNCTGKYYAAGNCTCDGTGNCVPTPTPTPTPTPRPPTPTPTPPVILLNCNEACVSRGFASGYCDSAAVYPGEFLCESGETNIGWTKDCYVEQGILGIKKGCCCQPTPAPTPEEILMMISNYEDFRDASPEPFSSMRSWTLTEGDGLKTVWAKFKVNGVWTEPVFDTIILDTSEPEVTLDLVKVWFKQQEKALGKGHEGAVLLYLKQGGSIVSEKAVQLDENGEARDVELPGVTAGTYDAFIYEPGYLTKKLANVEMKESGNTLDFTKGGTEYFLVGDFNGDQVVNILDFSIFVESYDKSGEE